MLPPDRQHVRTEHRHAASMNLDTMSVLQCVSVMVDDHRHVADAVADASAAVAAFIDALVPRVRRGGRLIYIGAGTSGRLGVLDASECPPTFQADPKQIVGVIAGGDAALRRSSEGLEDDPDGAAAALAELAIGADDTLLGIAAGGTTPYVLGALRHATACSAVTGLLTCAGPVKLPHCDHLIALDTGPEVLTGSTRLKAGSATKLVLNIITTTLFTQLGKAYGNLMVDLRATNDKLTDRAIRILCELCPGLDRAAAAEALRAAGGELKIAVVMQRCGCTCETARAALHQAGGSLRQVLHERAPADQREA